MYAPIGITRTDGGRRKPAGSTHRLTPGFTLLEVLLAIVIFGLVVTLIFGSFQGVFSASDHVSSQSDLYEMGNACLDRISRDLKGAYVIDYPRYRQPDADSTPDIYRFQGKAESGGRGTFSRLRFTSLAHLPSKPGGPEGIARIVYYIQEDDGGGFVLRRADKLYPYGEFEENALDPAMCEQVREFKLTFYDEEGQENEAWDSESGDTEYSTPRMVRIKLVAGSETDSVAFETAVLLPLNRPKKLKR